MRSAGVPQEGRQQAEAAKRTRSRRHWAGCRRGCCISGLWHVSPLRWDRLRSLQGGVLSIASSSSAKQCRVHEEDRVLGGCGLVDRSSSAHARRENVMQHFRKALVIAGSTII